jgi:hypothetical protein
MFGNLTPNPNPTPAAGGSTFGLPISFFNHKLFLTRTLLGSFGGGNNNPSMFGAAKPAGGFGAFGGGAPSAFGGGGGTFGSAGPSQPAASNPNLFGQQGTSGGAFGAGNFGSKPATSAFGATTCMLEILLYLSVKLTVLYSEFERWTI